VSKALRDPVWLLQPKKLLVILDLNGTLLYRTNKKTAFKPRKNVDLFLLHLLQHHRVMIWSSSHAKNVQAMVNQLFPEDQRETLLEIWARDTLRLDPTQFANKVQVYKRLEWVWGHSKIQACPEGKTTGGWNQDNTVLLDDSFEKAAAEPFNLVQIPEFTGQWEKQDVLDQVLAYIDWLAHHEDVSAAIRSRPFKTTDSKWKRTL
jgi:hypothetical protein